MKNRSEFIAKDKTVLYSNNNNQALVLCILHSMQVLKVAKNECELIL